MTAATHQPAAPPAILVFGGGGQLGRSLAACAPQVAGKARLVVLDRAVADITDADAVARAFDSTTPTVVINAAAYTAVDRAESEQAQAFAGNALGPYHLARECAAAGVPLFHISTDYVFSGKQGHPWRTDDPTAPPNAYGRSKLAGEWAVMATHPGSYVFRTAWVFSPWGNNFVKTMLRLGRERDELGVVHDQYGCPTYAPDLAAALVQAALGLLDGKPHRPGIYHFTNLEPTTWHAFACAIFDEAAGFGGPKPRVRAITTPEFPTPAARPAWSVLDLESTIAEFGLEIPTWRDALARCIAALYF